MDTEKSPGSSEFAARPDRREVRTSKEGLVLREMIDETDDREWWKTEHEPGTPEYFKRYGNTVDETPEATTIRREEGTGFGKMTRFGIRRVSDQEDTLVGQLEFVPRGENEMAIGIEIKYSEAGKKDSRPALEAGLAVMTNAGITNFVAEIDPENEPSLRLFRGSGFLDQGEGPVQLDWGLGLVLKLTTSSHATETN